MLVYGDHSEQADPRERLEGLGTRLSDVARMPRGRRRHSALVTALIDAGQLLQGVADADFASAGADRRTPAIEMLTEFLLELGRAVDASWSNSFSSEFRLPPVPQLRDLPEQVELRLPEGFAFYAVYPEAYADAARRLRLHAAPCVIGVRSIGTSLAAMVAAALGAPRFYTMRPVGEPFDRRVAVEPALADELLARPMHYVIVDEGPGMSGSSFGGIADWLQSRGVPLERIAFVPSHGNPPGAEASDAHRARWDRAQKAVADLGPELPQLLRGWLADLIGPRDGELVDLSAGAWRELVYSGAGHWPPASPGWERRKYLVGAGRSSWLVKFAGLGGSGMAKLERARSLHQAGLVPEPRGLAHGFLVERWHAEASKLGADEKPIAEIARYIGTRARLLTDGAKRGASIAQLLAMAKRNASLALGDSAAKAFERWESRLGRLEKRVIRVETDSRLDRHEWLRLADGRLLKTDALDHSAAHDLIGCQDIAWDVAGAAVEFDLDGRETAELAAAAGRAAGRLVDPELLSFFEPAYLAFRVGQARLSMQMCASSSDEVSRWRHRAAAYERRLEQRLLESSPSATRRESLVD